MAIFASFFFQAIQARKMSFMIFQNENNNFLGYKNIEFETSKRSFFRQYMPGKCLLCYSRTKKTPFQPIKTRRSKRRKIDIFQKGLTHGCGVKNGSFSNFFFLGNIGQENVFRYLLERKNAFLGYKNKKFKQSKIEFFPKGLTHGFGQKMASFQIFFFRQFQLGKCLL